MENPREISMFLFLSFPPDSLRHPVIPKMDLLIATTIVFPLELQLVTISSLLSSSPSDVSIRDSQRGVSNANFYPGQQYPVYPPQSPAQQFAYPYGPGSGPNIAGQPLPGAQRPNLPTNMAGPGMVPFGMPPQAPQSSQIDPGCLSLLPS